MKESETIEFKKSSSELKEAVISIVAMLNKHNHGAVFFGIDDRDGKALGMSIGRNTVKEITQAVVDNIEPKIFPNVEYRKIDDKDCIVVEAHGINSPYFAYGRAYIRVGESDKALSVHEIETRILSRKKFLWESEISDRHLKDVNTQTLKNYMKRANDEGRINFKYSNVKTTLKKLHLLSGEKLLKAAEVLFCDNNPMEIQAAVFAGTDKVTFLDIKKFKGNIFSLRKQAEAYVKEHIKWRADLSESRRREIPEIPVRAFSEAIGNSLCHRDYANPKGNEVAIFKDRIDIYNPGVFPDELTPEDFIKGDGYSILRNPLIAETMYMSADIEKWASGLKRIYDECTAAGVKVEFKRVKTGFVVSFYRPKWEEGEGLGEEGQKTIEKTIEKTIKKNKQKILDLVRQNPKITVEELAKATGLSSVGVRYNLNKLKKENVLKRVGPDKGGHWEVL
jgi:ATP-dependent DNA helicase RecG